MKSQLEIDLEAIAAVLLAASAGDLVTREGRLEALARMAGVDQSRVPAMREALRRIHGEGLN
jgi:hypothetical protein